jgi:uncharacterized protein YutE (UPF0331/DUF86 family)
MIDQPLIEKKLRKIEEFLKELKIVNIENYEEFKRNIVAKRFIERNLELAIEQMIDICKHLVSGLDLKEPETFAECFEILGKVPPFIFWMLAESLFESEALFEQKIDRPDC